MKSLDLIKPAQLYALAALDGATKNITLVPDDTRTKFSFVGSHCGGETIMDGSIDGLKDAIAIEGERLLRSLSLFNPTDDIKVWVSGSVVNVRGPNSNFKLGIIESEYFPLGEGKEPVAELKVKSDDLRFAYNILSMVATTRTNKPIITGGNMIATEKGLMCRATDGSSRAAISRLKIAGWNATVSQVNLTATIGDVLTAISVLDAPEVTMTFYPSQLRLTGGVGDIWISAIKGEFPPLDKLPRQFRNKMPLQREALVRAIQAGGIFHKETLIQMTVDNGRAFFAAAEDVTGEFKYELPPVDGIEDVTIVFEAPYLDVAARFPTQTLNFSFNGPNDTVLLEGGGWYYWTAPIINAPKVKG